MAFEAVFTGMSARLQEGNLKFRGLFFASLAGLVFAQFRDAGRLAQICGFGMQSPAAQKVTLWLTLRGKSGNPPVLRSGSVSVSSGTELRVFVSRMFFRNF
ncbi:hypothetical protein [Thalassospira sp.]|uniref:hypothetical protein n=1 Tax=Thalassospira sp. TaxID=1912094 RepID=UPI001B06894C|nr:hypothetical protein [Thalassospira sp.]MBO6805881.1 hypothetical protein [Thalassospira sp.]MBO6842557.1 hypothetical protein [Thalassospira sp.]